MGNMMERAKMSCEEEAAAVAKKAATVATILEEEIEKEQEEMGTNVTFHLFSYRQQMGHKKHQIMKWATSKLLLTEELLKLQQAEEVQQIRPRRNPLRQRSNNDNYEQAMLTDDEDENEDEELMLTEEPLARELLNLKNYRLELRGTILAVAQEKVKRREKKKLKRLKRRTLISSKKPSNKDKRQLDSWQSEEQKDQSELMTAWLSDRI